MTLYYCSLLRNGLFLLMLLQIASIANGMNLQLIKKESKINEDVENDRIIIDDALLRIKNESLGNNTTYNCLVFMSPNYHPSNIPSIDFFAKELNYLKQFIFKVIYINSSFDDSIHLIYNGKVVYSKELNGYNIQQETLFDLLKHLKSIMKNDTEEFKYFTDKYSNEAVNKNNLPNFLQRSSTFPLIDLFNPNTLKMSIDKRFTRLLSALIMVVIFFFFAIILFTKAIKWSENSQQYFNNKREHCIMEMISNNKVVTTLT